MLEIKIIPFIIAIISITVIAMISIITTVVIANRRRKKDKPVNKTLTRIVTVLSAVVTMTGCITGAVSFSKYNTALSHGLYNNDITIKDMLSFTDSTPVEDSLPEDLTGCIVIYYKFDCSDCSAIYSDLKSQIADKDNIYWVSTRSKQGSELIKKYPVEEVPSGIYIRKDSLGNTVPFTNKKLYTEDENGNSVLNQESLDRLLFLQTEGR